MKKATGDARSRARRIVALLGFPILLAAVFAPVVIFRHDLWGLFSSVHKVEEWVRTSGPWAPLAFIGIQVFHVIIFIIPGEAVQIAGGYLFGIWPGALYAAIGVLIGSPIDFYLARLFGVPFVNALFTPQKVEKLRAPLGSPGSKAALFLLFLIPGIPKDAVCYVSGLSPLRFRFFILASMAGRLPGIIGSSFIGSAAADQKWLLAGAVFAGATLLFAAGFFLRKRIQQWLHEMALAYDRRHR